VCIVSGGLDSVCFAASLAENDGYDLYLLTFAYGQRAEREIERSRYFANVLNAKDHKVADMGFMKLLYNSSNALTDSRQELSQQFSRSYPQCSVSDNSCSMGHEYQCQGCCLWGTHR
jgi:7-cyano-7-deazaguanine synthase